MPRERKGTVYELPDGRLQARITLPDGRRVRLKPFDPGTTRQQAEAMAEEATRRVERRGAAASVRPAKGSQGETLRKWTVRWTADRKARGHKSTDDDSSRLENHVLPVRGDKPIASITKSMLEDLVERLDRRVQAKTMAWKTAVHVWSVVSTAFKDATNAKTRALRVLAENPALGVRGPDRGTARAKAYLYPSEFLQLVACEDVPLRWRRIYTLAVYSYTRAGELLALEWPDVDETANTIHVHHAINIKSGKLDTVKTDKPHHVPIEAALLPLLRVMRAEAGGKGALVTLPRKKAADQLRRHLLRAKVTRADLHTKDDVRKPISFHDLRGTAATWAALRGDAPLVIMQRCGHVRFETTMIYIREAEALGRNVGVPFPPLPASLLEPTGETAGGNGRRGQEMKKARLSSGFPGRGGRDLNSSQNHTLEGDSSHTPPCQEVIVGRFEGDTGETPEPPADPLAHSVDSGTRAAIGALVAALAVATQAGNLDTMKSVATALAQVLNTEGANRTRQTP
jgi:integrase